MVEQANVHIDAETNNGDVHVEIPLDVATLRDKRVVGDIGSGSASLRLRTSNGSITVRQDRSATAAREDGS